MEKKSIHNFIDKLYIILIIKNKIIEGKMLNSWEFNSIFDIEFPILGNNKKFPNVKIYKNEVFDLKFIN
jgi:hypothetical protein